MQVALGEEIRGETPRSTHAVRQQGPADDRHGPRGGDGLGQLLTQGVRALLPDSMSGPWGLAADFLTESHLHLTQLRGGIVHRTIGRDEALALQARAHGGVTTFQAALQHTLAATPPGSKAHLVMNRLLATTEMLMLLLRWNRDSIEQFFDDSDRPSHVPSTNHR
jgi:hypothetical protein